jgi:hypothetical protein
MVDEEEMIQLIAFLRSLGTGETPPRVEQAAPPAQPQAGSGEKKP